MKKASEYREFSLEELESIMEEKSEELMNLKIRVKMHQVDNSLQVREMRREIAMIKTVIHEKKVAR